MAKYNYRDGKDRVSKILDSKTIIETKTEVPSDSAFNFGNGIKAPVASIFVDIRKSSELFKNNSKDRVARIIRSFISEVAKILRSDDSFRDLGIRGDCVFAVYSASTQKELDSIFDCAVFVNTYIKMLNAMLEKKGWPNLEIGIGLGFDPDELVVKAGEINSGFNDFVWIGNAVIDASNCCNVANKKGIKPIVVSESFYNKIKNCSANDEHNYDFYFVHTYSYEYSGYVYHVNLIKTIFNNWIDGGMCE